jgi:hypothetical protein
MRDSLFKKNYEEMKLGTQIIEMVPNFDKLLMNSDWQVKSTVNAFNITFQKVDQTDKISFSFKLAQLINFCSCISTPYIVLAYPSRTQMSNITINDSKVVKKLSNLKVYSCDNPHPVYSGIFSIHNHYLDMLDNTFGDDAAFPFHGQLEKELFASLKMSVIGRAALDQFAAHIINIGTDMLVENNITNNDMANLINANTSVNCIVHVPTGEVEQYRLRYKPTREDWKSTLLYILLDQKARSDLYDMLKYSIQCRNILRGTTTNLIADINFTSGRNSITNFQNGILTDVSRITVNKHIEYWAAETLVDFFDVEMSMTPVTDYKVGVWNLFSILGLSITHPKLFWQGLSSIYPIFQQYARTYINEFLTYIRVVGEFCRIENGEFIREEMSWQKYNLEAHWAGIYPSIFVRNNYNQTQYKDFKILTKISDILRPNYVPYDLDKKRAAEYPYVSKDYTYHLSWQPIKIEDWTSNYIGNELGRLYMLVDLVQKIKDMNSAFVQSSLRSEFAVTVALHKACLPYIQNTLNFCVAPMQRSLANSFLVCVDRTVPKEYYKYRPPFSLNREKLKQDNYESVKLLSRQRITIDLLAVYNNLFSLITIFPRGNYALDIGMTNEQIEQLNFDTDIGIQPSLEITDLSLNMCAKAKKMSEALYIALVAANGEYNGKNVLGLVFKQFMDKYRNSSNMASLYSIVSEKFKIDVLDLFRNITRTSSMDPEMKALVIYETDSKYRSINNNKLMLLGEVFELVDKYFIERASVVSKLCLRDSSPIYNVSKGLYLCLLSKKDVSYRSPENFSQYPRVTYDSRKTLCTDLYADKGIGVDYVYKFELEGESYVIFNHVDQFPKHVLVIDRLSRIPLPARELLSSLIFANKLIIELPDILYTYEISFSTDRKIQSQAGIVTNILKTTLLNDHFHIIFEDTSLSVILRVGNLQHSQLIQNVVPMKPLKYRVVGGGIFDENLKNLLIEYDQDNFCPGGVGRTVYQDSLPTKDNTNKIDSNVVNISNRVKFVSKVRDFEVADVKITYPNQV